MPTDTNKIYSRASILDNKITELDTKVDNINEYDDTALSGRVTTAQNTADSKTTPAQAKTQATDAITEALGEGGDIANYVADNAGSGGISLDAISQELRADGNVATVVAETLPANTQLVSDSPTLATIITPDNARFRGTSDVLVSLSSNIANTGNSVSVSIEYDDDKSFGASQDVTTDGTLFTFTDIDLTRDISFRFGAEPIQTITFDSLSFSNTKSGGDGSLVDEVEGIITKSFDENALGSESISLNPLPVFAPLNNSTSTVALNLPELNNDYDTYHLEFDGNVGSDTSLFIYRVFYNDNNEDIIPNTSSRALAGIGFSTGIIPWRNGKSPLIKTPNIDITRPISMSTQSGFTQHVVITNFKLIGSQNTKSYIDKFTSVVGAHPVFGGGIKTTTLVQNLVGSNILNGLYLTNTMPNDSSLVGFGCKILTPCSVQNTITLSIPSLMTDDVAPTINIALNDQIKDKITISQIIPNFTGIKIANVILPSETCEIQIYMTYQELLDLN